MSEGQLPLRRPHPSPLWHSAAVRTSGAHSSAVPGSSNQLVTTAHECWTCLLSAAAVVAVAEV